MVRVESALLASYFSQLFKFHQRAQLSTQLAWLVKLCYYLVATPNPKSYSCKEQQQASYHGKKKTFGFEAAPFFTLHVHLKACERKKSTTTGSHNLFSFLSFFSSSFSIYSDVNSQHSDVELMLLFSAAALLLLLFVVVFVVGEAVWPLGGEVGCREEEEEEDVRVMRSNSAEASVRNAALTEKIAKEPKVNK